MRRHLSALSLLGRVVLIADLVPLSGTQLPEWGLIIVAAVLVLLKPLFVILALQRWFVQGLVDTESCTT